MGRPKLLLPWAGKPLIKHLVDTLEASLVKSVIVVAGDDMGKLQEAVGKSSAAFVPNPEPDRGMLSSVRVGLENLPRETQGVMIVLGDQPSLTMGLIDAVVAHWRKVPTSIVRPVVGKRGGHPLVFPVGFRDEILVAFDDCGLKGLLEKYPERIRELLVEDEGVAIDIDTPADYLREQQRIQGID